MLLFPYANKLGRVGFVPLDAHLKYTNEMKLFATLASEEGQAGGE